MDEETLPAIRLVSEDYDPEDAEHLRQYQAAGSPNLASDNWRPCFYEDLQEDGETYVRRPYPEPPASLTDVEIMTPVFIDYRRQATLALDGLKAQVWSYLKNTLEMEPSACTAAGVALCKSSTGIGVQYDDFIKAGGHPDAAADLWARLQEIKGNFAWIDAGVEAIFAAALGQSQ